MAARITIIDPDGKSRWFLLEPGQSLTIGRGTESDIIVLDRLVSRRHCTLTAANDGYAICDLGGVNGTLKGGQKVVDTAPLRDGDVILVGDTKVLFSLAWVGRSSRVSPPVSGRLVAHAAMLVASLIVIAAAAAGTIYAVNHLRNTAFAPSGHALRIESIPTRAMAFVDDRYVGLTPLPEVQVLPGPHSVRLVKANYQDHTQAALVDDVRVKVSARLVPVAVGLAVIETEPAGAEVYLDGELVGATPLRKEIPVGEHDLRLQKTNYLSVLEPLVVKAGGQAVCKRTLKIRQAEPYLALLKTDPNNCSYHAELAHVYLLDRRIPDATKHLRMALDIMARDADTSAYAVRLRWLFSKIYANNYFHWAEGDAQLAEMRDEIDRLFLDVLAKYPQNDELWKWLLALHSETGIALNKELLRRCLKISKEAGVEACVTAATQFVHRGQFEEGVEILEMAAKVIPNDFEIHYTLGKIHYRAAVAGTKSSVAAGIKYLVQARGLTDNTARHHQIDAYLARLKQLN